MKIVNQFLSRLSLVIFGFCFLLGTGMASPVIDEQADNVIRDFMEHVDALSIDDQAKSAVKAIVEELRADDYSRSEAVTAGLTRIYPEYASVIQAVQNDESTDPQAQLDQLKKFVESEDKFLAADASFVLGRTLLGQQHFEQALPLLENLTGDLKSFSLYTGPALYFTGVSQASLLENQRAITSFSQFLNDYSDAPERLRDAAWRQIQTIRAVEEGGMTDVLQRMDFSRRRLEIKKTGEATQTQQERIVGMLAKLIKEQEKKECSSCCSSKNCEGQKEAQGQKPSNKEGEGQGKSNAGGTSNNPNGVVRRTYDDGPASPWSQLRNRTRDAANNAIKDKLPARYKRVVEQYYDRISGNGQDK